jgi:hypothetical protein
MATNSSLELNATICCTVLDHWPDFISGRSASTILPLSRFPPGQNRHLKRGSVSSVAGFGGQDVRLTRHSVVASRGFAFKEGPLPTSFVLADTTGLEVDVHAVTFDEDGNGI